MEDVTLALITLTSFVLLFVVAIFADRAGANSEAVEVSVAEPVKLTRDAKHSASTRGPLSGTGSVDAVDVA